MKRAKLIALKEKALDQMILCASVFHGNKPPFPQQVEEMQAHAALVSALCAELGEPINREYAETDLRTVLLRVRKTLVGVAGKSQDDDNAIIRAWQLLADATEGGAS